MPPCPDGQYPQASLTIDSFGNLYGTTFYGGVGFCDSGLGLSGCGTVFELSPPALPGGTWTETVLWKFGNGDDGITPTGRVTLDDLGNVYTTTAGSLVGVGAGMVVELSPSSGGRTEKILYAFCPSGNLCPDGAGPLAGVIFDASGNLYGTAVSGGTSSYGVVYKLSPGSQGEWTESVLYSFDGTGGANPMSDLVLTGKDLVGTFFAGGKENQLCAGMRIKRKNTCGGAFKLASKSGGAWIPSRLLFDASTGSNPAAGLVLRGGSAYGTTSVGGASGGGTAFEITGKNYIELYSFCSQQDCSDGDFPSGLTEYGAKLYGAAGSGGTYGQGVVFQITP